MHDRNDAMPPLSLPPKQVYIDECARLTVAMVPRLPPVGQIRETVRLIEGVIGDELPFTLRVTLVRGHRGWLYLCPLCARPVFSLYFKPGSAEPACRVCHRLEYRRDRGWERHLRRIEAECSA